MSLLSIPLYWYSRVALEDELGDQLKRINRIMATSLDKELVSILAAEPGLQSVRQSVEKSLSEHGDKVDDSIKSEIETNITTLKELLEKEDASSDDLKEKTDALIQASMKLGEAIYKAQQAKEQANTETASSEQAAGDEASNDDNVVDAEYEDVEDNDKK